MGKKPLAVSRIDEIVAEVLDDMRLARDLSVRELGRIAGVTHVRLGRILRHRTNPMTVGELEAISAALGTSGMAVLGRSEIILESERDDHDEPT